MIETQATLTAFYASYKIFYPQFGNQETILFFISSGIWNIMIGIDYEHIIPEHVREDSSFGPVTLIVIGCIYSLFGLFPQKLKYLILLSSIAKTKVFIDWIKEGCSYNQYMTAAIGDILFAILFFMVFYQI